MSSIPPSSPRKAYTHPPPWREQLLLALCVLIACALGIASRPAGFSAVLWPANGLLIGLLVRNPDLALRPLTWLYCFVAYCAADVLSGSGITLTLGLNAANLLGVLAGWLYLAPRGAAAVRFKRQQAVLQVLATAIVAACGGALLGAPLTHLLFGVSLWHAALLWCSGELFNLLLILPLVLAAPRDWFWHWNASGVLAPLRQHSALPLLALIASEALSYVLRGPGMLGFSIPALIWCAMAYGVFPITVINLLLCLAKLVAASSGLLQFAQVQWQDATSFFTGLALMSLAPLAVAVAHSLRSRVLRHLKKVVDHDDLTGALSRRALMTHGRRQLQRLRHQGGVLTLLMMDLDHFKRINDRHGHAQGDAVLRHFSSLVLRSLRPGDLFARVGGEEFVLLLPETGAEPAMRVAERVRMQMRDHPFGQRSGEVLNATVSMGLRAAEPLQPSDTLEQLLAQADAALYEAKAAGRDQVRRYAAPEEPPGEQDAA